MKIQRVKTGIKGLDSLIEGGIPKNSINMVSGGPGSGKTNFCLQYLYEGLKKKENGLLVTFEELPEDLLITANRFGWNFKPYLKNKKFDIHHIDEGSDIKEVLDTIKTHTNNYGTERLVVDSVTALGIYATTFKSIISELPILSKSASSLPIKPSEIAIVRRTLYKVMKELRKLGNTTFVTSEVPDTEGQFSRYGVEEFLVDGIIALHYSPIGGNYFGNIEIRKMRKTKHSQGLYKYDLTKKGLTVTKDKSSVLMK